MMIPGPMDPNHRLALIIGSAVAIFGGLLLVLTR